jgi:hypothetical protein
MSINSVKYHAGIVVERLHANGHAEAVRALERLVADLAVGDRVDRALNDIISHCDVRELGNLGTGALPLTEWLKAVGKLERSCRRTLKERGALAVDDIGYSSPESSGEVHPETDPAPIASGAIAGGLVGAAAPTMRHPAGDLELYTLDDGDDGETAALRHFIAAGAFVLAMMAAVLFILTVYRVPNLWRFSETATVSDTMDHALDFGRGGPGTELLAQGSGETVL